VAFTILPNDFSIHGGELTPTHKLKRAFTAKKYERRKRNMDSMTAG
jgi:long-subunit acyl-CoA synthetase (AMP-forming)